jgi:hypothetical protein
MADFTIQLDDGAFEILKETNSLEIFDVETSEETGEFDYPDDIIKTHQKSLNANIHKEAQKEGLDPEKYSIKSFLILAKNEDEANELGMLRNEEASFVACVEVAEAEVNGSKGWNLYLLGALV